MGAPEVDAHHYIAHSLRAEGFDASEDGTGRGTPLVPVSFTGGASECISLENCSHPVTGRNGDPGMVAIPIDMRQASRGATMTNNRPAGSSGGAPGTGIGDAGDPSPTVSTSHPPAVAFSENQQGQVWEHDSVQALNKGGGKPRQGYAAIRTASAVRRLTPVECEKLQGFPPGYTLVPYRGKPAADGPRYKSLGNSMAVPVMAWIGQRIAAVEALQTQAEAA